ncbi:hypothetical protein FA15DRAFT_747898 [Coprinopsis marcescibilis]|uniref:F-box domain-containing protein n=1 Tax=Coprinopsis marcescibilis TaxID=230819 RepID=A0A5C3L796_COPMA|nr:hypothetical protein FA15DRAFT_747898 [Coprinopsis marcescibilis]
MATTSITGVESLPNEVLNDIFGFSLPPTLEECTPDPSLAPLLLTHVCGRWRDVAQGSPRLWEQLSLKERRGNTIFVSDEEVKQEAKMMVRAYNFQLGLWSKFSGTLPLSFFFRFPLQPKNLERHTPYNLCQEFNETWKHLVITAVSAYHSRIRSLHISNGFRGFFEGQDSGNIRLPLTMPQLETLSLDIVTSRNQVVRRLSGYTSLRRVFLHPRVHVEDCDLSLYLPWQSITHLCLFFHKYPVLHNAIFALGSCPLLQQATLTIRGHPSLPNFPDLWEEPVVLRHLTHLEIDHGMTQPSTLYRHFEFPALRSLTIRNTECQRSLPADTSSPLIALSSMPKLASLIITNGQEWFFPDNLIDDLSSARNLVELKVESKTENCDVLFKRLATDAAFLPNLEKFEFSILGEWYAPVKPVWEEFLDMVVARRDLAKASGRKWNVALYGRKGDMRSGAQLTHPQAYIQNMMGGTPVFPLQLKRVGDSLKILDTAKTRCFLAPCPPLWVQSN